MEPTGPTLLSCVIEYLARKDTNYAVLITGGWGIGKTFFWHNSIYPEILTYDSTDPWIPIYVSLNGQENSDQLSRKILYAYLQGQTHVNPSLIEKLQGPLSMLAAGAKAFSGFAKPFVEAASSAMKIDFKPERFIDFINFQKTFICFDDLERCQYDNIWGYINDFVEHKKAKVIILANEEKLITDGKNDCFKEIKEKVVGKTIKYNPASNEILDNIIDHYPPGPKKFLEQECERILDIFQRSDRLNFRVLRSALDDYIYLYQEGAKLDETALLKARLPLLRFALAAAIEHRTGQMSTDAIESMRDANLSMAIVYRIQENNSQSQNKPYALSFIDKYFGSDFEWDHWFLSVIDFICDGVLNTNLFQKELTRYQDIEPDALTILFNIGYWQMTDTQFEKKIKVELLSDIFDGKISLALYPRIFRWMNYFQMSGLLECSTDELVRKFLSGIEKISTNGVYDNKFEDPREQRYEDDTPSKELLLIGEATRTAIELLREKHLQQKSEYLFSLLPNKIDKFFIELARPQSGYNTIPIFSNCDVNLLVSNIMLLPSNQIFNFRDAISYRYKLPFPPLSKDIPVLKIIGEKIIETLPKTIPSTLSSHLFRELGKSFIDLSTDKNIASRQPD